ncbi:signal peptidase I [Streptosporangium sp. NPDC023615]|uniref:signal peptidase I n=1 Tax=Streptosporangium sp. NPDC023615 TaxID=3154794 RepID=UPI003443E805
MSSHRSRTLLIPFALALVSACSGLSDPVLSKIAGKETYRISSESMAPTLVPGELVTATRVDGTYAPRAGDVVVLLPPASWGLSGGSIIKRVIGVPGSTVGCCDAAHRMIVDGRPLDEPYVADERASFLEFAPVAVPEGHVWVQGDHRDVSLDSRSHRDKAGGGMVPVTGVIGVVDVSTAR